MALVGAVNGDPSQTAGATTTATTSGPSGVGTTAGPTTGATKTVDGRIKKFNGTTWNDMGPAQSTATQTASGVGNVAANQIASTIANGPAGVGATGVTGGVASTTNDATYNAALGQSTGGSAAGVNAGGVQTGLNGTVSPGTSPTATPENSSAVPTTPAIPLPAGGGNGDGGNGDDSGGGNGGNGDSNADAMQTAKDLAEAQQFGAVNSAIGSARAAGMSPAQAALMGAQQGATTYSDALGKNYYQGNGQRIQEMLGKLGIDMQQGQNNAGFLGGILQAAPALLSLFLAEGTDNATPGPHVVGEHGPELVELPAGAKVTPIKDGYDMIAHGLRYGLKDKVQLYQKAQQAGAKPQTLRDMVPALDQAIEYVKTVRN